MIDILRAEFVDEARWRDVLYVAVTFPLSIIEFVVVGLAWAAALFALTMPVWFDPPAGPLPPAWLGSVAGVALLFVAGSLSQLVMALHRQVVVGLLCTSESRELRREVETLRQSRSDVLAVEATELAGSSATCMTAPSSGWSGCRSTRPRRASGSTPIRSPRSQLVREGQEQARAALAEIRQLVRGIAPAILLDRGLVAAIELITGGGSVETAVISGLAPGERLPPAVERAAYFVVSEALANVAKHSGATRSEVRCRREGGALVVEVRDDGRVAPTSRREAGWRVWPAASRVSMARSPSPVRGAGRRPYAPTSRSRRGAARRDPPRSRGRSARRAPAGGRPAGGRSSLPKMLLMCSPPRPR